MISRDVPTRVFAIDEAPGLDRIVVIIQDFGTGRGRLVIECFGWAWAAYWGAMPSSIDQFIRTANPGYLVDRLICHQRETTKRGQARERAYLARIMVAVREALEAEAASA